jgi:Zn-dependent peptidase ImmA (M78 family)
MDVTLKPIVLQWARVRAGLSVEELARKVGTQPNKVTQWEIDGILSLKLAEKVSAKTYTPFGYLYLDAPPEEKLPIDDFRTVGSVGVKSPSPDLLDTLDKAIERQEWFREYAILNNEAPLDFVGSLNGTEEIEPTARTISQRFSLETSSRAEANTWEDAFKNQCEHLESGGVLVMKNGVVGENTRRPLDIEEFRGFALADKYAPLIFINIRDVKAAQIFTLLHELVHIWLGVSGVSNLEETQPVGRDLERFCNAVAAEILVPAQELRERFHGIEAISDLCNYFKVSTLVILRRLLDLGLIQRQEFTRRYSAAVASFRLSASERESGGNYYRTKVSRLGKRFIAALLESTLEGQTTYVDAFRLLGVRSADTMNTLAKELKLEVS